MKTKAEFYNNQKVIKNLVETEPTFKPAINKNKKQSEVSDRSRVDSILEKGKAYQERKE